MKLSITIFVLLVLLILATEKSVAQRNAEHTKNYDYALKLLNSFKIDSAKIVLDSLFSKLTAEGRQNSEFSIRVRLRQAEVWEHDYDDKKAIESLHSIVEQSRKAQYWDIVAEAHISLARLYEKLEQAKKCFLNLNIAQNTIEKHNLKDIYPKFAIRMASYYRVFRNQIDSATYYANRALETLPKNKISIEEGTAHLLLAIIHSKNHTQRAIFHYKKAGSVFGQVEDFTGYSFVLIGLSKAYLKIGQIDKAIAYNDSSIIATVNVINKVMGKEHSYLLANPILVRAEIFKSLGNLDSSWHYINQYYKIRMEAIKNAEAEKIMEVEARYNGELKSQKITEQQSDLEAETQRKNWIASVLFIVFAFASIILYQYIKLRELFRFTKEQANEIHDTNVELKHSLNQQGLLQKEVHHRVTNNLQTIISLLEIQADGFEDGVVKETFISMSNRIYSMAAVHAMLYMHKDLETIVMQEYTELLCQHLKSLVAKNISVSYKVNMGGQKLNLPTVIPLGIILNELITNSIKHYPKTMKDIRLNVELKKKKGEYFFRYSDNGAGMDEVSLKTKKNKGLGLYLIESMTRQVGGNLKIYNEEGAVFEIIFKEKITKIY